MEKCAQKIDVMMTLLTAPEMDEPVKCWMLEELNQLKALLLKNNDENCATFEA